MPSFSTFALNAAISSVGLAVCAARVCCCLYGAVYGISHNAADSAAHACHSAKANTHVGELPHGFVLCHLLRYIEAALLLA